jgi:polyisoprenoid-binding protein YceI
MKKLQYVFFAGALMLAACDTKPKGDEAEISEAKDVQEVKAEATYALDKTASTVGWIGLKPGGRHFGTFGVQDGALQVQDGKVVGGELTIDLNKIEVADLEGEYEQKLTDHLKSPDFFHVGEYPTAKFVITSVEPIEGQANAEQLSSESAKEVDDEADKFLPEVSQPTHKITGNLSLRDTTLSISFPALVSLTDSILAAKARFVIDRTKWNVSYGDETSVVDKAKDKFVYNNVAVGFDLKANQ